MKTLKYIVWINEVWPTVSMYHVRSLSPSGEGTEHTVDCYNPRTNTWSKRGKMRAPRRESSAVCIGNKIYILGTFPISTFLCFGVLKVSIFKYF